VEIYQHSIRILPERNLSHAFIVKAVITAVLECYNEILIYLLRMVMPQCCRQERPNGRVENGKQVFLIFITLRGWQKCKGGGARLDRYYRRIVPIKTIADFEAGKGKSRP
jgi:hypothetical protein